MGQIKLLDCTLRDGGYINDWNFGHDNLVSVFERLVDAGVDIIEIGFLDERRPFDIDRSIMPNTDCVEKIYGGIDKKQAMVVGMIDYGTCGLENIKPCSESYLDGIRVIFKKHLREEAMAYCGELKKLGYHRAHVRRTRQRSHAAGAGVPAPPVALAPVRLGEFQPRPVLPRCP